MAEAADFQGMTPSPARRWALRAASLLVGAPFLAGMTQLSPAPAAYAAHNASGSRSVDVSLNSVTPAAPVKGDTVTLSGTVTNKGRTPVTEAHIGLRVGSRLSGRTQLDTAADRTGFTEGTEPEELETYVVKVPELAPGISADFSLAVPVDKLDLDDPGVYQLGVTLSGKTKGNSTEQVLGAERTFLPWQSGQTKKKTQFTYLWPLISTTRLSAETGSDEQQTPVFENDDLAKELAPGGRLEQLVSLGDELSVTWVIDPDLLATVEAMVKGYTVKDKESGNKVPGSQENRNVAKNWLNSLEKAVKDQKVVALPFADPDLASLAHRGKKVPGSLNQLQRATEAAAITVDSILHVKPSTDFAWPVDGAIDPAIVNAATSAGAHNVIARSDSLSEQGKLLYTPTAARPIGAGRTAVVADARLSTAFQGDMSKAENATLAVQQFLAHTLALTLQDEDKQRSIVVAPQRMPSVTQVHAMASALRALSAGRWTQPLDLEAAAKVKPDPAATTKVPGYAAYPDKLRDRELPTSAFETIKTTQQKLDQFKVVLTRPERVVPPFGNAINREMSTSWRGKDTAASAYREDVQDYLLALTKEVNLIEKSTATLSGRSATIPVTVQNKLVQDVDHLVLRLRSTMPTRLKLGEGDGQAETKVPIKVRGGHSQSVKIPTTANANGKVQVVAQLFTEDNTPYGPPMQFTVKVNEVTPTIMLVIAGGVLLLVLAGIKMYSQRKRAAARGEAPEDGTDQDEDPEQPSDPTTDTGPESGEPKATGEKVDR
ncbi:hypothetical protein GCM10010329_21190 [Streptomyces spiroverticillatus]|uniref:Uncharacterized protein n=1 Tax=Streptomyces finlayi TaxID=67296 RepID=A0A918WU78_9ACTN|nr:DUF6049 family protein [Streptomyces finlayi]GGZ99335.1 hypothetical protein GCM10010329_21190 [Streptomyces spiroverticillatus]GHC84073.1 hypothetical protein GCM10010334_13630 [Streptomyces finlayi]